MLNFNVLGLRTTINGGGVPVPWWFVTTREVISIYDAGRLVIAGEATFWHDHTPLTRLDQLPIVE
ncbi:MAG: hypothetical protein WDN69_24965 [Aliidongia sp.]